ncbi:hypothetical protein [Paraburkholderia humisilvae]|uniref:Uncharacterized protein n=1 Tax=Paraburkholderia humisilvae TaxID=627669 RepID=A0A6J5FA56_9BURK|nr:hypothetical protein [Paraburkholderia humisilvae]CAB3774105.1 hypothetical protein LMG29542_07584 [Paraburkholderia humisilvae]
MSDQPPAIEIFQRRLSVFEQRILQQARHLALVAVMDSSHSSINVMPLRRSS